jgi:hypothetical protein
VGEIAMDWNLFYYGVEKISTVLGLLLMAGGLIGGIRSLYLFAVRPKIALSLCEELEQTMNTVDAHGRPTRRTRWAHVTVRNKSKHANAQNCRVYVTDVWKVSDGVKLERVEQFHAKQPLQWAHREGAEKLELIPQEEANIDLFVVSEGIPDLHFVTGSGLPTGTMKSLPQGRFKIKLVAFADNSRKSTLKLSVDYQGGFALPKLSVV